MIEDLETCLDELFTWLSRDFMKIYINKILIVLFIIQGVASFSIGGSVYSVSVLKYLKYIIFGLFIICNMNKRSLLKIPFLFFIILFYIYMYCISRENAGMDLQLFFFRFMNLLSPLFLILIPKEIISEHTLNKIINIVTISSCLFCFFEYLFLRDVFIDFNFMENGGYYRCISFFIGPNNAATIFFLLIIYYCTSSYSSKYKLVYILLLLSSIVMTGSKTPILLFIGYIIAFVFLYITKWHRIKLRFFKIFSYAVFVLLLFYLVYNFMVLNGFFSPRELHSPVDDGRFYQIVSFGELLKDNMLFPTYNIYPSPVYDNLYIQLWSDFGLIGLVSLLLGIIIAIFHYYKKVTIYFLSFLFLWFILGFTLNSLYAWPLSYLFYFIILKKTDCANEV